MGRGFGLSLGLLLPSQAPVRERPPKTAPEHQRDQHPKPEAGWGRCPRGAPHPGSASHPAAVLSAPREYPLLPQSPATTQCVLCTCHVHVLLFATCPPTPHPSPLGWASSGASNVSVARGTQCSSLEGFRPSATGEGWAKP